MLKLQAHSMVLIKGGRENLVSKVICRKFHPDLLAQLTHCVDASISSDRMVFASEALADVVHSAIRQLTRNPLPGPLIPQECWNRVMKMPGVKANANSLSSFGNSRAA